MTPELIAEIKAAVGPDVDPSNFAVFEVIALNDLPLPGKDGGIFEKAVTSILTLRQMADSINAGNHLPLIFNHNMETIPLGRVFRAQTLLNQSGSVDLRALFYIDDTNPDISAKIDAGSLDEVSVQFLASQILCSECEFDYRGETATWENFVSRTCDNGHTIGTDGVHARLVGLQTFTELSLVTRGAAKNPKIVGRSQSKLVAPLQALAARGFEVDELFLTASKGEVQVDLTAVLAQLTEQTDRAATARAELATVTGQRDSLQASLDEATGRIADLEASLADNTDVVAATAELSEAKEFLGEVFTKLAVAAGETDVTVPESIADLKAGIEAHRSKLTAMIPVGGAAVDTRTDNLGAKFDASRMNAFKSNR